MRVTRIAHVAAALALLMPGLALAQAPKPATYITDEQVKAVNAGPGVDRQLVSVDIGKLNLAVGIIHRGSSNAPPAAAPAPAAAAATAGTGLRRSQSAAAPSGHGQRHPSRSPDRDLHHRLGHGTLVTGGRIVNGRKSAPDSQVTQVLNGPSCSGRIEGADVVKKVVKTGDIIIIPAGTPHGWGDIPDHVDYLSVRPDPDRVLRRDTSTRR